MSEYTTHFVLAENVIGSVEVVVWLDGKALTRWVSPPHAHVPELVIRNINPRGAALSWIEGP